MPSIYNINSTYNINTKKIVNKLSFELNQEFAAKVENIDKLTNEVLLKMLDGWQFKAELQGKPDNIPEGIIRFKVEGFEDGKLKIKIQNQEVRLDKEINNMLKTLEEQNVDISKSDIETLAKMVKHSMPLTRENISEVKSLFDFKNRIKNSPEEVGNFIQKFLELKGIEPASEKGQQYTAKLKVFFNAFNNITEDDILTLMENDIEINDKNIESFNRVFKESQTVYKQLAAFSQKLNSNTLPKPVQDQTNIRTPENGQVENLEKLVSQSTEPEKVEIKALKTETIQQSNVETTKDEKIQLRNLDTSKEELIKGDATTKATKLKPEKLNGITVLSNAIKEEINSSSNEVKNAVIDIISNLKQGDESTKAVVTNFLQNSGNDFKVLNTVSNQYYYFDLPIKMENHDYGCKMIIKDERKKGKLIDTNDVKIAATINTENIGTVDSYLTIKNYNMTVDIKSEEKYIKILSSAKEILLKELSNLGYNISVTVDKRKIPVSLSDSREFFQDNELININARV
ncbi:MAG: hypothetical protein ACM3X7_11460 [Solirubrobacterales bacterium]